jgi:hypothetical protein
MEALDLKHETTIVSGPESLAKPIAGVAARMRRILGDRFVEHAYAARIIDAAELLLIHPSSRDLLAFMLAGSLGAGRSMLAEAVMKRFPVVPAKGFDYPQVPVIRFSLTGAQDPRALCTRILDSFGDKYDVPGRGAPERRVLRRIGETRTKLLIADNVHDLRTLGDERAKEILDALQYIVEEGPRRAIYITEPESVTWLARNEFIGANFGFQELPTWTMDDVFKKMLEMLEGALALRKPSRLNALGTAEHILKLSGGNTGRIMRLVKNAGVLAIHTGEEMITTATLDAAIHPLPPEVIKLLSAEAGLPVRK